ncbi:hypothetical protein M3G91_25010 [Micromonospora chalcea]|uniref:hypothetical protein n=1 Tax=Micromonospora chalcea TaxID=1874 RepID=UPI0021A3C07E|nr:hypothetical protein [Micromonospora chalcea]MCT2280880.1 hypothetical protein [Micromonospora chalcea]
MQTTIQTTATDQDAADIATCRRLARKLKAADPNGPTAQAITRQYKAAVARLGYDPIS